MRRHGSGVDRRGAVCFVRMGSTNRLLVGALIVVSAGIWMCGSDDGGTLGDGTIDVGDGGKTGPIGPGTTSGCGASCIPFDVGAGTSSPFNLATHENAGVTIDPTGALTLDPASTGIPNIIWIANTGEGTVTKVDTKTYKVLGRYAVGPSGTTLDPSRTSVNSAGDVFLGNRSGGRLVKISSAGAKCPDTNKDGKVTTSTGLTDVLPWGQDDCVLWEVSVPGEGMVRGVAAQDIEVPAPIPDDPQHVNEFHAVWAGGTTGRTVRKFDGETGALLISTASPTAIYGLALDGNGQLYMSGNTDGASFGRVDTNRCKDQASCDAAEICVTDCDAAGACTCTSCTSGPCENAIKERINLPDAVYGITVDYKQRVWLGGNGVKRYDPKAPAASRYTKSTDDFFHGIAADAKGFVWAANGSNQVRRVNGDTMQYLDVDNVPSKGMAVDRDGKIWAISLNNGASVVVPGPLITDNTILSPPGGNTELSGNAAPTGLGYCYTYSDMTGQQLALANAKPGYYRQVIDSCSGETTWFDLSWTVNTPPNTKVSFYGRTADTKDALPAATWVRLATAPPDTSPVSLAKAFGATPLKEALEIEVRLAGTFVNNALVSPTVSKFGVTKTCVTKAK